MTTSPEMTTPQETEQAATKRVARRSLICSLFDAGGKSNSEVPVKTHCPAAFKTLENNPSQGISSPAPFTPPKKSVPLPSSTDSVSKLKKGESGLSEYGTFSTSILFNRKYNNSHLSLELLRLKNIKRNNERLKKLGLICDSSPKKTVASKAVASKTVVSKFKKTSNKNPAKPSRRSTRQSQPPKRLGVVASEMVAAEASTEVATEIGTAAFNLEDVVSPDYVRRVASNHHFVETTIQEKLDLIKDFYATHGHTNVLIDSKWSPLQKAVVYFRKNRDTSLILSVKEELDGMGFIWYANGRETENERARNKWVNGYNRYMEEFVSQNVSFSVRSSYYTYNHLYVLKGIKGQTPFEE